MNYTQNTEDRRKYPRNVFGGKSEWDAIVYHKQEIDSEIKNVELEIKHIRERNYTYYILF